MDLVIVRHARPVRIEPGEERADPHLTELGKRQAEAVGKWLEYEHFDAIYSSPMRRAIETAEPIMRGRDLELQIEEGVQEYDSGLNQYIPYEELKATKDESWQALANDRLEDLVPAGGEFRKTVYAAMASIIERHPGQRVCVVCHGGVINVFLAEILEMQRSLWLEAGYASISRVVASRNGARSVASVNEMGHLRGIE